MQNNFFLKSKTLLKKVYKKKFFFNNLSKLTLSPFAKFLFIVNKIIYIQENLRENVVFFFYFRDKSIHDPKFKDKSTFIFC